MLLAGALTLVLAAGALARQTGAQAPPVPVSTEEVKRILDEARQNATKPAAIKPASVVIDALVGARDPEAHQQYLEALAIRGGAYHLGRQDDKAKEDFVRILTTDADYAYPAPESSPRTTFFEEVRRAVVGSIRIKIAPPEADGAVATLDGQVVKVTGSPTSLLAKTYKLSVVRVGYGPVSHDVEVAPGKVTEVSIDLKRTSRVLRFFTAPAGVDILLNGEKRGTTQPGPTDYWSPDWNSKYPGLRKEDVSKEFAIEGFGPQDRLEVVRPCWTWQGGGRPDLSAWTEVRDYTTIFVMAEAKGKLAVVGPAGARVSIDGEAPQVLPTEVAACEGTHSVLVWNDTGSDGREVSVSANGRFEFVARLRPTIAIVAHIDKDNYVGTDARLQVIEKLRTAETVLTAPDQATIDDAFRSMKGSDGKQLLKSDLRFIDYDENRHSDHPDARNMTDELRLLASRRLSESLGVQAIAQIRLVNTASSRRRFRVTVLARGSAVPDVIVADLDDPKSLQAAQQALGGKLEVSEPALDVTVADVADRGVVVTGVVKGSAAEQAGIRPGDLVQQIDGTSIGDVAALRKRVGAAAPGKPVVVQVTDAKSGAARPAATLTVRPAPRLITFLDTGQPFNVLIARYRAWAATADSVDSVFARLNLAVALMAVTNWEDASKELDQVKLGRGGGVSLGTVEYLKALCLSNLGRFAEARESLDIALAEPESLLTENGPPIGPLAATLQKKLFK